ncbi:MAG TPA: hypothetical protein VFK59_01560 [Actinomycetota bacterium]|nr:hypothetical protein [Actinomycetota bacterium]
MRTSNAGFWKVFIGLAAGGVLLVLLVVVFRPVARTGAVAYAQSNLRDVAEAAERLADEEGSLAAATRQRLELDPALSDLLLIDPDQASNDSEVVSVSASEGSWTGSARADTGECFWIRVLATGETVLGTGTDCSGDQAGVAAPNGWPEP